MDATTFIKENLDVHAVLKYYDFDGVSDDQGMIRACCKIHGGDNPSGFVINPETGLYYCHTGSCGGGDVFTLAQTLDELSFKEAIQRVAEILHIDISELEIAERKTDELKELQSWTKVMQARRKKVEIKPYVIPVETKEITKFRDFLPETLNHFGVRYIQSIELEKRGGGVYELRDRVAVPIHFGGIQVGMSMRKTKAKDYPKWSHQPRGLETRSILYNYDEVQDKPVITVVEGMFDVWAFYEVGIPAVCTFGAHITEEQYKLLMLTGADLVFAYDGDTAGEIATQKAKELFMYKANMDYVVFDEGEDPASIDRNQLKLKYESRRRLC